MGWREFLEGKDGKERILTHKSNIMETKFYVGQRVKSETSGYGTVLSVYGPLEHFPIVIEFDNPNPSGSRYRTKDGRIYLGKQIDIFPADPEPFRLTEWQKDRLKELVDDIYNHKIIWHTSLIEKIESILSEPEQPKYQPKQGDGVLVRDYKDAIWVARVATGEGFGTYNSGAISQWKYCRPFDADLVGKVTD